MANYAYGGVWVKGFSEATLLEYFEGFLNSVPFSAARPGFTQFVARAVDPAEPPLVEHALGLAPLTVAELVEVAHEYVNADCALEVAAWWDLWAYDDERARWVDQPQKLDIFCYGPEYDDSACAENGHFRVDLGFEHLFTGHADLLGSGGRPVAPPQHPTEAAFLSAMTKAENLREYQAKTRENIRRLLDWMQRIAAAVPVERTLLWSEGEENFEARLDEIVAAR